MNRIASRWLSAGKDICCGGNYVAKAIIEDELGDQVPAGCGGSNAKSISGAESERPVLVSSGADISYIDRIPI